MVSKVVKFKFSQRSYDDLQSLFSDMFPDSEIARKITLQKGKCQYVISHGLAPYCEQLLIQNFTASPCHSLSFDGSLNKKIQVGQMDLYVRFWDVNKEFDTIPPSSLGVQRLMVSLKSLKLGSAKRYIKLMTYCR